MTWSDESLTSAVQRCLDRVGEIPQAVLVTVFLVVGLLATAAAIHAALVSSPACRRAWAAIAATCALWTVSYTGLLFGLHPGWIALVTHPLCLFFIGIGVLTFPGAHRPATGWVRLVLDGWMSVGGVVTIAWILLQPVMHAVGRTPMTGMLIWSMLDFLVASTLSGLIVVAAPGVRRVVGFATVSATLSGVGDLCLALTGNTAGTALIWIMVPGLIGLATLIGGPDLFLSPLVSQARVRVITLSRLPLVPTVVFLFVPLHHDLVANLLAGMVIAVAFGNVAVHSKRNASLVDRIRQQRSQFEAVLTGSQDVIMQLRPGGRIEFANPAVAQVLGYPADDLPGVLFRDLLHPDDAARTRAEWAPLIDGGVDSVRLEFRLRHADGGYRFMESTVGRRRDRDGGFVLSTRDVTAGVALRRRLARQARTDPLTGLMNRAAMLSAISEHLHAHGEATLLFIDLDEFKSINDTLGHSAGDDVLIQVAHRLRAVIRAEDDADDAVARLGGDEFAVLVPASDPRPGEEIAAEVLDRVARVRTPEHLHTGRASVGIVSGPAGSPEEALRDADLAMYQAKASGGGVAVRFEPWMRERMIERSRLRAELEGAVSAGGLSLALQPVVDLDGGDWLGFEALVRWPGPPSRMPDEFLPLAEETGLIVPLGNWVLGTALGSLARWDRLGPRPVVPASIAVNVSPRQLDQPDFAGRVLAELDQHGIAPGRLVLEITEQTAVQDLGSAAPRLSALRDLGVHVAIDDFGTGYSSLRYLTRLPVDQLKIDKQFVAGLGVRADDEVLVTTMLRLAADLGLEVVAEGVETQLQAQFLRGAGCRLAQGYLYSLPIPMDQLTQPSAPIGTGWRISG